MVDSIRGRIVVDGDFVHQTLHLQDGKIVAIDDAPAELDLGDQVLLPGAVDVHVHFRDPGFPHKEDWASGSKSAALGGVTTVVDMPNTVPATLKPEWADQKLAAAASKSIVDYGIWAGATWRSTDLTDLLERCVGLKIYLGATTGDLLVTEGSVIRSAIEQTVAAGKPVIIHCEAQRILDAHKIEEHKLWDHHCGRPPAAEVEAIRDVAKVVEELGLPRNQIHVAHIASAEAVEEAEKQGFSMGVCPHHLFLHTGMDLGTLGKMNPPLREEEHRDRLMAAFRAGKIPLVESDHAPHTMEEKDVPFAKAPAGVPGVATLLPLLLAEAVQGKMSIDHVIATTSTRPAALIQAHSKGALAVGKDADIVAVHWETTPCKADALGSVGWTPFEGLPVVMPTHVWRRGETLVEDSQLQDVSIGNRIDA